MSTAYDLLVAGLGGGLLTELVLTGGRAISANRGWLSAIPRCLVFGRNDRLRVSFAALLCVRVGDQYLMIRSERRPESFGPVGGVYRAYADAKKPLTDLGFVPQAVSQSLADRIRGDLRGTLPAKHLFRFLRWFRSGSGRESGTDCMRREMVEEFQHLGLTALANLSRTVPVRWSCTRRDGPTRAPDGNDYQYQARQFDVFELVEGEAGADEFLKAVNAAILSHSNDLLLCTAAEINAGRTALGTIGHQSCYLLSDGAARSELPAFQA